MGSTKSSRSSSPANELRLEEWTPDPLVPDIETSQHQHILNPRIVTSKPSKHITVDGKKCLNLGTHDYLGIADDSRLLEASVRAAREYGVGSCGPRAFYGTMDVHLKLEEELARFLGVEETVLYSFGFSTIASAIPAYAKPGDIVFVDEQCNFAIQQGVVASRSEVIKFAHNDPQDFETRVKQAFAGLKKGDKLKKIRTFIIVEGISAKTGQLCKLKQFIEVAKKYKIRLFLDESCSFGVLGSEGKGITQELEVDIKDVDLIMSSLEGALCSFGGFCAGSSFVVDHQRLAGSGYCFSASLPPLQTRVALESLAIIRENPSRLKTSQAVFKYANQVFDNLTYLRNNSNPLSPIKLLCAKKHELGATLLEELCNRMLNEENIALSVSRYMEDDELTHPVPSIRLILNGSLTQEDIQLVFKALERISLELFSLEPVVRNDCS